MRWRYPAGDVAYSVRDLGDVNADGAHDVLAAIGDNVDEIVCLDGGTLNPLGNVLWLVDPGASAYACEVMPDITGDGIAEALAVLWTTDGSAIRCLNGATGSTVWSSTEVFEYGMMADVLEDVTGDGYAEIIVSSWENAVIVLDGFDGSLLWKTVVGTVNGGDVWTARAIDDLNRDGFPEVAAGTRDTNNQVVVHVLEGDAGIPFPNLTLTGSGALGSTLEIEVTGQPGMLALPAASLGTASIILPPFGTLGLAPPYTLLPAGAVPANGVFETSTTIPNDPILAGLAAYVQALVATFGPSQGSFSDVESIDLQ